MTQSVVVNARVGMGYEIIGSTTSLLNGGKAIVIQKGRHFMVVNSLGYDEHVQGKTWRIEE